MIRPTQNTKILWGLVAFVVIMIGLSYASVPLYRLFCQATGFGGTTQRTTLATKDPSTVLDRTITVTFDANVDSSLPWEFSPEVRSVRVKLGDITRVNFHAVNKGSKPVVGTARYNVQPDKAGAYFEKIQCFCFTEQLLKPGEQVSLPVEFYVDEALAKDVQNDDVQNITLSYTFFLSKDQSKANNLQLSKVTSVPLPTSNP